MFILTNGSDSDDTLIIDGNEESRSNTARHSKHQLMLLSVQVFWGTLLKIGRTPLNQN